MTTKVICLCSLLCLFWNPDLRAGKLIVGNNFGNAPSGVLEIEPESMTVTGAFGDATDFRPAPGAMAQDSSGRIYILDTNRDRIQRFDTQGNFIDIFGSTNFGVNGLYWGIAIDRRDNVYVSSHGPLTFDTSDDEIHRFGANGEVLGTFGQADNQTSGFTAGGPLAFDRSGNLYTVFGNNVVRYAPDGSFLGTFGDARNIGATAMAFDAKGHLFLRSGANIVEFDRFGASLGNYASGLVSDGGLTIDSQGNLYTSERGIVFSNGFRRYDDTVKKFSSSGQLVATLTDARFDGISNLLFVLPEPSTAHLLPIVGVYAFVHRRRSSLTVNVG